ncbi:condensin complex protein MksE [Variovorax sp. JS1663]|uniref:condensin complex protein MksE n=1 Tax=Variovorax sp. JS1663 TaxID=1851577 RepID=UPI000B346F0B|nr:hypothetical protein [Variovorax sp. JS1663]OUM00714.1 hypothetical protein A8M77_19705 [Variovorax sp. JS1663]
MKLASTLKALLAGEFICPVAHPDGYDLLIEEEHRTVVEAWVAQLGLRLVRLSDEGAFFLAPEVPDADARTAVRESLRNVRANLSPIVPVLAAIREAQGQDSHLQPGLTLWESELAERVRLTPALEQQVMDLALPGLRLDASSNDRVSRMLEYLVKERYAVHVPNDSRGYKLTGKIDFLYAVLEVIAENTDLISDTGVVDQEQMRLPEAAKE